MIGVKKTIHLITKCHRKEYNQRIQRRNRGCGCNLIMFVCHHENAVEMFCPCCGKGWKGEKDKVGIDYILRREQQLRHERRDKTLGLMGRLIRNLKVSL